MKIAIGTLARDSEKSIPKYKSFLIHLKKELEFDSNIVHSFIVENDSIDNTKILLKEVADFYLSENLGLPKFDGSPATLERATAMCSYRNKLKNLIFDHDLYDIVIFTDIDLMSWPDIKIIRQNIERIDNDPKIAAITSNGLMLYNQGIIYYDIWSLVINGKIQNHRLWYQSDIGDMEVDSAFGGLAIYYGPVIKTIKYDPIMLDGFPCPWHQINRPACEHCGFNLQIRKQNLKILIDKKQILYR